MATYLSLLNTIRVIHTNLTSENIIMLFDDEEFFEVRVKGLNFALAYN